MKKLLLFLISFFIGLALFFWVSTAVGWTEIKNSFLVFTGWQGLVILFLSFVSAIIGAWKWQEVLKETGGRLNFKEVWRIYLASFAIRFLAPIVIMGAEIFQGYILKKKNNISWSGGVAAVIIDRILECTTNLVVIFFGGVFLLAKIGWPSPKLAFVFAGLFLLLLFSLLFFYFKVFRKESLVKTFVRFFNQKVSLQPLEIESEIFNFFKLTRKKIIAKVLALNFLRAGTMLLRVWFLVYFLQGGISVFSALTLLGFSYLAVMLPIPMSLGLHEVIQTFAFNSLGLGVASATAFTMIVRGAELIVAILGVAAFFRLGLLLLKKMFFDKISHLTSNRNAWN
jgi:uncharacterized protein (TIRG00374 family)